MSCRGFAAELLPRRRSRRKRKTMQFTLPAFLLLLHVFNGLNWFFSFFLSFFLYNIKPASRSHCVCGSLSRPPTDYPALNDPFCSVHHRLLSGPRLQFIFFVPSRSLSLWHDCSLMSIRARASHTASVFFSSPSLAEMQWEMLTHRVTHANAAACRGNVYLTWQTCIVPGTCVCGRDSLPQARWAQKATLCSTRSLTGTF